METPKMDRFYHCKRKDQVSGKKFAELADASPSSAAQKHRQFGNDVMPDAPHAVPACGSFVFRRSSGVLAGAPLFLQDDCSAHIDVLELSSFIKSLRRSQD
jgi:hypothetical protein